jgi:D-sedoheptulose 7-phosphate isomerase
VLKRKIQEHCNLIKSILKDQKKIETVSIKIANQILKGGKLLLCGNGGSAADAQHLAAEFLVRLRPKVNRAPIPAFSLATDTSTLTACVNDFSGDDIFLRPFLALKNANDILLVISTSGMSKNIIKVLKEARKQKILSVGFLGKGGGSSKKLVDNPIIVKSKNTALIQECHIFLGHVILENVENELIKKNFI